MLYFFACKKRTPATKSPLPTSAERFVCQRLAAFGCAERRADPFGKGAVFFCVNPPGSKLLKLFFSNQRFAPGMFSVKKDDNNNNDKKKKKKKWQNWSVVKKLVGWKFSYKNWIFFMDFAPHQISLFDLKDSVGSLDWNDCGNCRPLFP